MKIALCISGQMRNYKNEYVKNNFLTYLFNPLNPDIFISTWGNKNDENEIFNHYENIKGIKIVDYDKWYSNIDNDLINIINTPNPPHNPTSYQQLFMIYSCNNLKCDYENKNNFKYDIVFRVRPDCLFIDRCDFSNFKNNTIYTQKKIDSNMVYDIFFYGDSPSMDIISKSFINYRELFNSNFNNGLNRVDANRILYIQALNNNIEVMKMTYRNCEVYRLENYNFFVNMVKSLDI
jgi:hypothetical protein